MEKKSEAHDSIIVMLLTSGTIPVFSRILDLHFGPEVNEWKTERIILLYLSIVVGFIISEELFNLYKRTRLYKQGLTWGDSDAIQNIMVLLPPLIVIRGYESIFWLMFLLVLVAISVFIIWKEKGSIFLGKRLYFVVALYMITIFVLFVIYDHSFPLNRWNRIFVSQILVCLVWDCIKIFFNKTKDNRSEKRNRE